MLLIDLLDEVGWTIGLVRMPPLGANGELVHQAYE